MTLLLPNTYCQAEGLIFPDLAIHQCDLKHDKDNLTIFSKLFLVNWEEHGKMTISSNESDETVVPGLSATNSIARWQATYATPWNNLRGFLVLWCVQATFQYDRLNFGFTIQVVKESKPSGAIALTGDTASVL